MRNYLVLMTATVLSACGGGGAQTAGSVAVGGGGAPTGSGGGGTTPTTDIYAQFVTPTVSRTYSGIGSSQVLSYNTDPRTETNGTTGLVGARGQQGLQYAGNASTVRDSKISITYDPRDAIFTLVVTDPLSGASANTRFQDPASRTNFGGAVEPQWGVDDFAVFAGIGRNINIRHLQAGDGNPLSLYRSSGAGFVDPGDNDTAPRGANGSAYQAASLFYEVPGSSTRFVSLAGYVRNDITWTDVPFGESTILQQRWKLERGAFAYGIKTDNDFVPTSGTGTYTGNMIATMIYNPTLDNTSNLPNYFQWLSGTSSTTVNFATGAVGLRIDGTVGRAFYDHNTSPQMVTIAPGTSFTASGTATINLVNTGGFTGQIQTASFGSNVVNVIGSSIDGAFFGATAQEVGGGFRIVGGTPDQRIDIAGAFTGAKPGN